MKKYQKPFKVKNGIIYDANDCVVKLWGVNYYAPFNHNYQNLIELGIDIYKAIDDDVEDFIKMGFDFVRIHIFDREISDREGNIVFNEHLKLFDYLVEKLYQKGIYFMITPVTYWNSSQTQVEITTGYAYWYLGKMRANGFSNYYPKHAFFWDKNAICAFDNYLKNSFERKNIFSGKTWAEYDNIIAIEPLNEPQYITEEVIHNIEEYKDNVANEFYLQERKLLDLYQGFLTRNNIKASENSLSLFNKELTEKYIERTTKIIKDYFGDSVLVPTCAFNWIVDENLKSALINGQNDCICCGHYPFIKHGFDTAHTDYLNILKEIRDNGEEYAYYSNIKKGQIEYEFDCHSTLLGYPEVAMGYMLGYVGMQACAYFTYTPKKIANYNSGWIIHYLNLHYTPLRTLGLIAGGELFRLTDRTNKPISDDNVWENERFYLSAKEDNFFVKGDNFTVVKDVENIGEVYSSKVIGIGKSKWLESESTGCYFMEIKDDATEIEFLPDQTFVGDPFHGRAFNKMSNRFISVKDMPVVSTLKETGFTVRLKSLNGCKVYRIDDGKEIEVKFSGDEFTAKSGKYIIKK